jgi:hypothetical protein
MKNLNGNALLIRYFGSDSNRYHILQRGNGDIWTGDGWSRIMDCAKVFREYRDAQMECAALQRQQYGGKPQRTFKLEMAVSLVADDVEDITQDQLAKFISRAVRIEIESSQFGDGPVNGSFVEMRLKIASLEETEPRRRRF